MLKVNDIQNITFSKSMNGYKATEVNAFIDECARTVESLLKEKEELEKKLEILADRLVEYRDDEDSIRSALLNAQRLGDTTVRESNHKAGLILEDAQTKSDSILTNARESAENLINEADAYALKIKNDAINSIVSEENTFERLKTEVNNFKAGVIDLYKNHLELINKIPEHEMSADDIEAQEQEIAYDADGVEVEREQTHSDDDEVFTEIEDLKDSQDVPDDESKMVDGAESAADKVRVSTVFAHAEDKGEGKKETDEKFNDLKFGEDYDIKDDEENGENIGGFFRRRK